MYAYNLPHLFCFDPSVSLKNNSVGVRWVKVWVYEGVGFVCVCVLPLFDKMGMDKDFKSAAKNRKNRQLSLPSAIWGQANPGSHLPLRQHFRLTYG